MPAMPSGGEERGDGGGRQADEEGGKNRERDRGPLSGRLDTVDGERTYVGADQQKDEGQGDQEHFEGDFVGGLTPFGPLDKGYHPVEEGFTRISGDTDDDGIGDYRGAAGDGSSISTRFAYHRCRLSGYRRLVHQGRTGDHLAVTGDQLMGFYQNMISFAEQVPGHQFIVTAELRVFQ